MATSFPPEIQTVQWKQHTILGLTYKAAADLCSWRQNSQQSSCLILMSAESMFVSGGNMGPATIFFAATQHLPRSQTELEQH